MGHQSLEGWFSPRGSGTEARDASHPSPPCIKSPSFHLLIGKTIFNQPDNTSNVLFLTLRAESCYI
jgi:hypothetical protein